MKLGPPKGILFTFSKIPTKKLKHIFVYFFIIQSIFKPKRSTQNRDMPKCKMKNCSHFWGGQNRNCDLWEG